MLTTSQKTAAVPARPIVTHRRQRLFPHDMPWLIRLQVINLVVLVAVALVGPYVVGHDPARQDLLARLQAPVWISGDSGHLLGTDHIGRDLLARVVVGLRTSLLVAAFGSLVSLAIGTALGTIAALAGNVADSLVMFLVEAQMAVPFTLLALVIIAALGTDLWMFMLLVGLAGWEGTARIVRGQLLAVKQLDFIEGARAAGVGPLRIAVRHVLPSTVPILIVLLSGGFTGVIFLESSLSFLGLGIQPPATSLGLLIGVGRDHLIGAWWIALISSALLVSLTMSIALLGDWLRDRFDPRFRMKSTRR